MTLGDKLRELRHQKEKTIREVAKVFNIGKTTYANYETDIRKPDYEMLVKLANYYNVTVDYLVGITEEKNIYKLEGNKIPKELRDIGVEYMTMAKRMQDKKIPIEDIEKIIDILRKE